MGRPAQEELLSPHRAPPSRPRHYQNLCRVCGVDDVGAGAGLAHVDRAFDVLGFEGVWDGLRVSSPGTDHAMMAWATTLTPATGTEMMRGTTHLARSGADACRDALPLFRAPPPSGADDRASSRPVTSVDSADWSRGSRVWAATWPLPKYLLPAALVATGHTSCALVAVLALNTWRKSKLRESLCPGSDPIADSHVAAAMTEWKLAIAETFGAAIRLETVSWVKSSDDEGSGIKHRSRCSNPLHGHDEEDVFVARTRSAASAAATDASRAAFLQFHGLLAERYPCMHAVLEQHLVGSLSLLFVWRGSDPFLPVTGLYNSCWWLQG